MKRRKGDEEKSNELMGKMPIAMWALYHHYFYGAKIIQDESRIWTDECFDRFYWTVE